MPDWSLVAASPIAPTQHEAAPLEGTRSGGEPTPTHGAQTSGSAASYAEKLFMRAKEDADATVRAGSGQIHP